MEKGYRRNVLLRKTICLMLLITMICANAGVSTYAAENSFENFTKKRDYEEYFADVSRSEWYYGDVKVAYETGIIDGRSALAFEPDGILTVAEVIKIASCISSIYKTGSASFTPYGEWYSVYVDYAKNNGIITSKNSDYNKPAKRDEAAFIFSNCLPKEALPVINVLSEGDVPDVSLSDSFGTQVYLLYAAGVMIGSDDNGNFLPETTIRRSEIAAVITRLTHPESRLTFSALKSITYNYHDYLTSGDKQLTFDYKDTFFAEPSNILNGNLAKASIALAAAALGDAGTGSDKNIRLVYKSMGYEVLTQQNYDTDKTDDQSDFAAFTIASKNTVINKKSRTIYSIAIRGTFEASEWYSNFDVGQQDNTSHRGFTSAASAVYDALIGTITTKAENTVIWITGHSRGAAISNIIAARLNRDRQYANTGNIFCYTFGCPAVTPTPYECDNIFNFNNPGDVLALVPFTLWGYKVNGVEVKLPVDVSTIIEMNKNFARISGVPFLGGYDIKEFSELVLDWCPTKADFYKSGAGGMSPYELFVSVISIGSGNLDVMQIASILFHFKNDPEGIRVALYLTENLIPIYHSHIFDMYLAWIEAVY